MYDFFFEKRLKKMYDYYEIVVTLDSLWGQ